MKKIDLARALRDPEYRNSLNPVERAMLPNHPSGLAAMDDSALRSVNGGFSPQTTSPLNCGTWPLMTCGIWDCP